MRMHKIGIIGAGAWGVTLGKVLAENGHEVRIWCYLDESLELINTKHQSDRLPSKISLPESIVAATRMEGVVSDAEYIVIALAADQMKVIEQVKECYREDVPILVLTKGLMQDEESLFVSDYIEEVLGTEKIAVLSGPNIAVEIAERKPAASVVASYDEELSHAFQHLISNDYFRIYWSSDLKGVALGGILKNVIAIAAGIADGFDLGTNAKSALITRGLIEIHRLADKFEARFQTIYGLSGLGDLVTTCTSTKSRNWSFGNAIAKYKSLEKAMSKVSSVTEGIRTAQIINDYAQKEEMDLPIMNAVYQVIYNNKEPKEMIDNLMVRKLKAE